MTSVLMTNISVILVSGGSGADNSVELVHTNGSRICTLPNVLPNLPNHHGHSQTGLTACGGWDSDATTCHTLSCTGSWEQSHSLDEERQFHSAWASPQGILLIGGYNDGISTELLLENGDTRPGHPYHPAVFTPLYSIR